MRVKKSNGKIYGADMTAAERKAIRLEIERLLAEYNRRNLVELDAIILWVLHDQCGFGSKRLRKFYDQFVNSVNDLQSHYEMGSEDRSWLCSYKLKEIGVDIEQWQKERRST